MISPGFAVRTFPLISISRVPSTTQSYTSFEWTLTYDEFYYVVDGVFDIIVEGRHNIGYKGDIMHIPKGTSVCFSSPETCRAVYYTYPADWANAE